MEALGRAVPRFQTGTDSVDEAAAKVLALSRADMRVLDHLREAPQPLEDLVVRMALTRRELSATVERLELFGYARRSADASGRVTMLELTPHAKAWAESLYGPARDEGFAMLAAYPTDALELMARFLENACDIQERHAEQLRRLTREGTITKTKPLRSRPRGALSAASLQRVQLFVAAHLDRPLQVEDLARRAELSSFHFSRAFKVSTGLTPHAYLHQQRVARAIALVRDTQMPLAQVALACGFSSQSRMTTAFAKSTGATPARFRRGRAHTAGSGQTRQRAGR